MTTATSEAGRNTLHSKRKWRAIVQGQLLISAATVLSGPGASASHPEESLAGSNFEIDTDANLRLDDRGTQRRLGGIDAARRRIRGIDLATGQNDDSYKGGVKEDTTVRSVTGSIPNNKADLLTFHGYSEAGDPVLQLRLEPGPRVTRRAPADGLRVQPERRSLTCHARGRTCGPGDALATSSWSTPSTRAAHSDPARLRGWTGSALGSGVDLTISATNGEAKVTGHDQQLGLPAAESAGGRSGVHLRGGAVGPDASCRTRASASPSAR